MITIARKLGSAEFGKMAFIASIITLLNNDKLRDNLKQSGIEYVKN